MMQINKTMKSLFKLSHTSRFSVVAPRAANFGVLQDEYGAMDASGETHHVENFKTQFGYTFPSVRVRYKTWGKLNAEKNNAMIICHALTGNANVEGWWGGMLGPGKPFDTDKYMVFCANILGSCYGTTGPLDTNPETGKLWLGDFPAVSVRDSAKLIRRTLEEALGVKSVATAIGGSLGGMQTVELLIEGADGFIKSAVPLACGGRHHAWQIGISELQRQALYRDPKWKNGRYDPKDPPLEGLNVARQIAMISYRSHEAYTAKFGRTWQDKEKRLFGVESYLRHQGNKFLDRFESGSYVAITKKMDAHDVADGRKGTYEEILGGIKQPVKILGIDSDVLYPISEQQELAKLIPGSDITILPSMEGHDGFLLEQDAIGKQIDQFLKRIGY